MEIFCTRPSCSQPRNFFGDLDNEAKIRTIQQRYCTKCGMPLLLADRYIPLKLLGQGGFGAAFLARDRYKPKMPLCVVKQFQPSGDLDAHELAIAQNLFQREAVVLEELGHRHPQIPDLYAFFTPIFSNPQGTGEEQYFYLAQEFIDGQDLETELATRGKFSEAEVTEILREVLQILEFVHDNNTIHRDIKPSNIMRSKQGLLYLLDFGAVKQVTRGNNHKKSTGIFSMGFAPPEQMSGAQVYPSTDIYALAVTCITLLTGLPAEQLYDSFKNTWNWQNYAPKVSDLLVAVLHKMLLSTPAERFQTATEALAALTSNKPPATPSPQPASNNPPAPPSPQPVSKKAPKIPPSPSSTPKPVKKSTQPSFTLLEVLSSAAFTGFEGAVLYIGLTNWLRVSGVSMGILGMTMAGLLFAQNRRIIEKVDLVILSGITFAAVTFIPLFKGAFTLTTIVAIGVISAAGAIATTAFFRLVYQLLSRWL